MSGRQWAWSGDYYYPVIGTTVAQFINQPDEMTIGEAKSIYEKVGKFLHNGPYGADDMYDELWAGSVDAYHKAKPVAHLSWLKPVYEDIRRHILFQITNFTLPFYEPVNKIILDYAEETRGCCLMKFRDIYYYFCRYHHLRLHAKFDTMRVYQKTERMENGEPCIHECLY